MSNKLEQNLARKVLQQAGNPASVFETEVAESGLKVVKYFDLFPCLSMWRTYVLRK